MALDLVAGRAQQRGHAVGAGQMRRAHGDEEDCGFRRSMASICMAQLRLRSVSSAFFTSGWSAQFGVHQRGQLVGLAFAPGLDQGRQIVVALDR